MLWLLWLTTGLPVLQAAPTPPAPLRLHPDNPHYFQFRNRPTVLITSAEHYGAVLNRDFNYLPYLDELAARGLNLTRTFTGVYSEQPGAFNIAQNTLAPAPGRLLTPWARSDQPGAGDGGNRFDLSQWNEPYFGRLRDFVRQASDRGVVVELVLFCTYYDDSMWALSPLNAANNINGIGDVPRTEVLTLQHPALRAVQESMVRRIVAELRDFDNVYYEICNEPYFSNVEPAWQDAVAEWIVDAESDAGPKHLIARNIANGSAQLAQAPAATDLLNFHYAFPPDAVAQNWPLDRAIGCNETGFQGTDDRPYRVHGWHFMLAGGALYNNLDYSFTVGHEDGSFEYPPTQPGGGGPTLRAQLALLKTFLERFDFLRMTPNDAVIVDGLPDDVLARVLAERGKQYALYLSTADGRTRYDDVRLVLDLPPGTYRATWLNPRTGRVEHEATLRHPLRHLPVPVPPFDDDLALRLVPE